MRKAGFRNDSAGFSPCFPVDQAPRGKMVKKRRIRGFKFNQTINKAKMARRVNVYRIKDKSVTYPIFSFENTPGIDFTSVSWLYTQPFRSYCLVLPEGGAPCSRYKVPRNPSTSLSGISQESHRLSNFLAKSKHDSVL